MKTVLSTSFRLTAFLSLGFWWFWMLGGAAYYYAVEHASIWSSVTSGGGIALAICVAGVFCAVVSEAFNVKS